MMTVVTTVTLKDEATTQWDRAMHERVRSASDMDGWVAVKLLRDVDEPRRRAIIGTWESREHWAAWHDDEVGSLRQLGLRVPDHRRRGSRDEAQRPRHVAFAVDAGKDQDGSFHRACLPQPTTSTR